MARLAVANGVRVIACTPHFLPGVYNNSGPDVRARSIGFKTSLPKREINAIWLVGETFILIGISSPSSKAEKY